jgi:hypothetical protein
MFGFLKRNKQPPTAGNTGMPPYFKSGEAALEMACSYMDCTLSAGVSLPALVLDSRTLFGAEASVKVQANGNQLAMLRVASSDGGFLVAASTAGSNGPSLEPGQLVAWHAMSYSQEIADAGTADKRFGWVGVIVGTLKPQFVNGSWVGDHRFAP